MLFKTGDYLPNGALVIRYIPLPDEDVNGGIVLAHKHAEYVTWMVGFDGHTFWGNYFPHQPTTELAALLEATKDFAKRVEKSAPKGALKKV